MSFFRCSFDDGEKTVLFFEPSQVNFFKFVKVAIEAMGRAEWDMYYLVTPSKETVYELEWKHLESGTYELYFFENFGEEEGEFTNLEYFGSFTVEVVETLLPQRFFSRPGYFLPNNNRNKIHSWDESIIYSSPEVFFLFDRELNLIGFLPKGGLFGDVISVGETASPWSVEIFTKLGEEIRLYLVSFLPGIESVKLLGKFSFSEKILDIHSDSKSNLYISTSDPANTASNLQVGKYSKIYNSDKKRVSFVKESIFSGSSVTVNSGGDVITSIFGRGVGIGRHLISASVYNKRGSLLFSHQRPVPQHVVNLGVTAVDDNLGIMPDDKIVSFSPFEVYTPDFSKKFLPDPDSVLNVKSIQAFLPRQESGRILEVYRFVEGVIVKQSATLVDE